VNNLFVHIEGVNNILSVCAETDRERKYYQINILPQVESLYDLLQYHKISTDKVLKELGFKLYEPINSYIEQVSEIIFVIPENYIKLPLDILYFKDSPLFIQKPVTYSFLGRKDSQSIKFTKSLSALIISDKSADPENGTYFFKKNLHQSANYYDINDINLSILSSMCKKDILLISAHGKISFDSNDCIELGGFE
jgi:hypothetical protein